MKLVNKICQVFAVILALASLVLFFTDFAVFDVNGVAENFPGSILSFGAEKELSDGTTVDMAISVHYLLCFLLTAMGAVLSICTFFKKLKKSKYFAPAFGLAAGIYTLVVTLNPASKFIDYRPILKTSVANFEHTAFLYIALGAIFGFVVFSIAHLFINDKIEVKENGGKTILKRVGLFLRDYKSEVKKIVWPSFKDVVKNTLIVLIMCLLVGALIWLLDFGLGQLLELILGI